MEVICFQHVLIEYLEKHNILKNADVSIFAVFSYILY